MDRHVTVLKLYAAETTTLLALSYKCRSAELLSTFKRTLKIELFDIFRASDSMFLSIDFVRVTNCFYDYDYDYIAYSEREYSAIISATMHL